MAKAILKFDLNDSDDIRKHLKAVHSNEMALLIWELKHNILRKAYKNDLTTDQLINVIESELNDLPFNIDDLIV